ncbi:hypothetical protein WICPIJ_003046 [Wickerhamomyces pijperi]|uniref:Uncharacterized protein n=1 Tax=Wickerhamomyces pijperi TaxID=599730 RepID=A0A9P8QAP1_WICPI|nr:hypothetical protein WICPIJ_003046 [Wickerhamomyces pijperi]
MVIRSTPESVSSVPKGRVSNHFGVFGSFLSQHITVKQLSTLNQVDFRGWDEDSPRSGVNLVTKVHNQGNDGTEVVLEEAVGIGLTVAVHWEQGNPELGHQDQNVDHNGKVGTNDTGLGGVTQFGNSKPLNLEGSSESDVGENDTGPSENGG